MKKIGLSTVPEADPKELHRTLAEYGKIAGAVARRYADRDWHRLSGEERGIVTMLEKSGYLHINKPSNGFVGRAIQPA